MSENAKWQCEDCDTIFLETEFLQAANPFSTDKDNVIVGCPLCKNVNGFREICDEPDCERDASCGFPTPSGYRRTCGEHMHAYDAAPVDQQRGDKHASHLA